MSASAHHLKDARLQLALDGTGCSECNQDVTFRAVSAADSQYGCQPGVEGTGQEYLKSCVCYNSQQAVFATWCVNAFSNIEV